MHASITTARRLGGRRLGFDVGFSSHPGTRTLEDNRFMAHKKGQGSSRNGRDSNPQMLGIKLFGGQFAKPGSILCRQRGTRWRPGKNVGVGRDWTIYSLIAGKVHFDQEGRRINVIPTAARPARELVSAKG
jgi:large subunit ribosomal protein L27